jgi:hypothetical protein
LALEIVDASGPKALHHDGAIVALPCLHCPAFGRPSQPTPVSEIESLSYGTSWIERNILMLPAVMQEYIPVCNPCAILGKQLQHRQDRGIGILKPTWSFMVATSCIFPKEIISTRDAKLPWKSIP